MYQRIQMCVGEYVARVLQIKCGVCWYFSLVHSISQRYFKKMEVLKIKSNSILFQNPFAVEQF